MTSPTIQSALDTLVAAIRAELRTEFISALGGGGQPDPLSRPRRGRKSATAKVPRRAKGAKRTPEELEALTNSVLAFIKKNPASRVEQIAQGLGTNTKELALPINKLWAAGSLKVQGVRRGMKYTAK